jgi:hypothetical protein
MHLQGKAVLLGHSVFTCIYLTSFLSEILQIDKRFKIQTFCKRKDV